MVGVPGRSKACKTCKRRKVACDQKQPKCGQCVKTGLECVSSTGCIFVVNEQGTHKTVYKKSLSETGRATEVSCSLVPSRVDADRTSVQTKPPAQNDELFIQARRMVPGMLAGVCNAAVARQQLASFILITSHNVGRSDAHLLDTWQQYLAIFINSPIQLLSGTLACYLAYVGRKDGRSYFVSASRQMYGKGLAEVQKAIMCPSTAKRDEVLAACLALGIYEALECPDESAKAYHHHNDGCLRLVELRGPRAHQTGAGHELFQQVRMSGAIESLRRRKPNFLSTPEWIELPFAVKPKTRVQRLLDIFLMGPEVLRMADELDCAPIDQRLSLSLCLVRELWVIDARLHAFLKEVEDEEAGPLYWTRPASRSSPQHAGGARCGIRAIALWHRDLETATTFIFFWSMATMVWSGLTDLYAGPSASGAAHMINASLPPLDHRTGWIGCVRNILQTIEYIGAADKHDAGSLRISVFLNIVIDVMEGKSGCDEEYEWALDVRKSTEDRLRMMKFDRKQNAPSSDRSY